MVGRDERAVARAAAAQDGEGEHAADNKPEIGARCKPQLRRPSAFDEGVAVSDIAAST